MYFLLVCFLPSSVWALTKSLRDRHRISWRSLLNVHSKWCPPPKDDLYCLNILVNYESAQKRVSKESGTGISPLYPVFCVPYVHLFLSKSFLFYTATLILVFPLLQTNLQFHCFSRYVAFFSSHDMPKPANKGKYYVWKKSTTHYLALHTSILPQRKFRVL